MNDEANVNSNFANISKRVQQALYLPKRIKAMESKNTEPPNAVLMHSFSVGLLLGPASLKGLEIVVRRN